MEIWSLIQGVAAWLIVPVLLASLPVPDLFAGLHEAWLTHPQSIWYAMAFGALWGVGGLTVIVGYGNYLKGY